MPQAFAKDKLRNDEDTKEEKIRLKMDKIAALNQNDVQRKNILIRQMSET